MTHRPPAGGRRARSRAVSDFALERGACSPRSRSRIVDNLTVVVAAVRHQREDD